MCSFPGSLRKLRLSIFLPLRSRASFFSTAVGFQCTQLCTIPFHHLAQRHIRYRFSWMRMSQRVRAFVSLQTCVIRISLRLENCVLWIFLIFFPQNYFSFTLKKKLCYTSAKSLAFRRHKLLSHLLPTRSCKNRAAWFKFKGNIAAESRRKKK